MDLENIAAELYGLLPNEFVAARTAAEKRARAAGDRELATSIRSLAKPTAAAWIANQLVRQHPDEIAGLRELGAGLREATATLEGDQLRSLSQQQNRVIHALVEQGRKLANAAGQAMSEPTERGLDATLRAALADEDLADQLACGQLATPLEHVGFAGTITASAPKPATKPATRTAPPGDELKERRRRAQVERAQAAVREARTAQRQASTALEQAETRLAHAEAALANAKAAMQQADTERSKAQQVRDTAEGAAAQAAQRVEAAQAELAALSEPAELSDLSAPSAD